MLTFSIFTRSLDSLPLMARMAIQGGRIPPLTHCHDRAARLCTGVGAGPGTGLLILSRNRSVANIRRRWGEPGATRGPFGDHARPINRNEQPVCQRNSEPEGRGGVAPMEGASRVHDAGGGEEILR